MANINKALKSVKLYYGLENYNSLCKDCPNLETADLSEINNPEIIKSTESMFKNCPNLQTVDLENFEKADLENVASMFENCSSLFDIDVSRWDTRDIQIYNDMFTGCPQECLGYYGPTWTLPTENIGFDITWIAPYNIYTIDLSLMDSNTITLFNNSFDQEPLTMWGDGTIDNELSHTFDTSNGTQFNIFTNLFHARIAPNIKYNFVTNIIVEPVSNYLPIITGTDRINYTFILNDGSETSELATPVKDISEVHIRFDETNVTNISFEGLAVINEISRFKMPSGITNMSNMFNGCTGMTYVNTITWDMTNVTDVSNMFNSCISLQSLEFSDWDTSNITNYENMFLGIPSLKNEQWGYEEETTLYSKFKLDEKIAGYSDYFPWNIKTIATYTFKGKDLMPTFNNEFIGITKIKDVKNANKTITRTILSPELPSKISFAYEKKLVSVEYINTSNLTEMGSMLNGCSKLKTIDVSYWDTSKVTDMCRLFSSCTKLENIIGLENWDTGNVTNMSYMFDSCRSLDSLSGIFNWDTSNVKNINSAFSDCTSLQTLDLSNWNISRLGLMLYSFKNCKNLTNLNLSTWDTSSVTSSAEAFLGIPVLDNNSWNYDGSNYNNFKLIEEVTQYSETFPWTKEFTHVDYTIGYNSSTDLITAADGDYKLYLPKLNCKGVGDILTSNIKIYNAAGDELPLSTKVSNIAKVSVYYNKLAEGIFFRGNTNNNKGHCVSGIEYIDLENIKTMENMFYYCLKLTSIDISNWVTNKIKSVYSMFGNCQNLVTLTANNLDFSSANSFFYMFYRCYNLQTIIGVDTWNTSNIENFNSTFNNCTALTSLDLTNWDTSSATDMEYMFTGCELLQSVGNLSNWDTSKVENMASMFSDCTSLVSLNLSNWDLSSIESISYMFSGCSALTYLNLSNWDTSRVTYDNRVFESVPVLDSNGWGYNGNNYTNFDLIEITSAYSDTFPWSVFTYMEYTIEPNSSSNTLTGHSRYYLPLINGAYSSTSAFPRSSQVILTLSDGTETSNFDTTVDQITKIKVLYNNRARNIRFYGSSSTSHCLKNLLHFEVQNLKSLYYLFYYCKKITTLDLSSWDTSNITDMTSVFEGCTTLETINISGWDTEHITSISKIFYGCTALKTINGINAMEFPNLTSAAYAFYNCSQLESIDISNWNPLRVNLQYIFTGCSRLSNVSLPVFENGITRIDYAFRNCTSLRTINLENINGNEVYSFSYLFSGCSSLETVYMPNLRGKPNLTYSFDYVFNGCTALKNIYGISDWKMTSDIYSVASMFKNCSSLTSLDLSNWEASIYYIDNAFSGCSSLTYLNISTWDTSSVDTSSALFSGIPALDSESWGYDGSNYEKFVNITELSSGYVDRFPWSEFACIEYTVELNSNSDTIIGNESVYLPQLATVENYNGYSYTRIPSKDVVLILNNGEETTDLNTTLDQVSRIKIYFNTRGFGIKFASTNLTNITYIDLDKLDSLTNLFSSCKKITSLDLTDWDVSNIYDMSYMFYGCTNLETLNLSNWDVSNVDNMDYMFGNCTKLTNLETISNWDVSSVESMNYAFYGSLVDSLEFLSNWDVSSVVNMEYLFYNCDGITTLDGLENWNPESLEEAYYLFYSCSELVDATAIANWNTPSLVDAGRIFYSCTSLKTVNLSNWDFSNVTSTDAMFRGCSNLEYVDMRNCRSNELEGMDSMFYGCSKLKFLDLSNWDTSKITEYTDMIFYSASSNIDWNYDGTNYKNWTLSESRADYSGRFPWS